MIRAKLIILFSLSVLLTGFSYGQKVENNKLSVADIITIHSKILNEDRKIYIYAPTPRRGGHYDLSIPLHVLYLMDGENHTAFVASEVDYLSNTYATLPPMLVVGIGNYAYDRFRDLTPVRATIGYDGLPDTSSKSPFKTTGGGENFLRFIKEEVMPYVEKNYKTAPFKIFSGHSLGGLMSYYCLITHPDMFNAYIAISPSLWIDSERELKTTADIAGSGIFKNKLLFFSDATEGVRFHQDVLSLDSILKANRPIGFSYKYLPYPDETHGSEPVKAEYDGLKFIYPKSTIGRNDTTAALINAFYKQLSTRYGYTILPAENEVNQLAYFYLDIPSKLNESILLFQMNAENYPASYNSFDSLGDAYAKKGDKARAIANYKKALVLEPKSEETKTKLSALQK